MRIFLATIAVFVIHGKAAADMTLFRSETLALRHCPSDEIVWLDFNKNVYYLNHHKRYGKGFTGAYVCRSEAKQGSFRRSMFGRR